MTTELEDQRDELVEKILHIDAQLTQRREAIEAFRIACAKDGQEGHKRYVAAEGEYKRWRAKAVKSKHWTITQLREVKAALRDDNIVTTEASYARKFQALRNAVLAHRSQTLDDDYKPTAADLALWAAAGVDGDEDDPVEAAQHIVDEM